MRPTKIFTTLALVAFAICTPIDSSDNHAVRAAGRHLTTGIATRNNGRPHIRHEVRDLKNNYPDHWNLYILALRAFEQMDQNDPLSSYRILGIHGRPYELWQEAPGIANPGPGSYCPHGNMLFATWHRPYLALFEQELHKQVRTIAEQASADRDRWLAAADSFRIPYFDSALGIRGGELPDFFTNPYLQVTGPDGAPNVISNPLYQYEFHPVSQHDFEGKWAYMNTTIRWPTTNDASAHSQPEKFRQNFYASRRMSHDKAGEVLQKPNFNEFAAVLEEFHGWMHSGVAGQDSNPGHFWPVEYSAFDPIFMLHHANVDRFVAIYQATHPDTWFEPADSGEGNLWVPAHVAVDANWPLKPFWKDDQSFYTSHDVRDTAIFGYAYPETQSWNYRSESEWRLAVRIYVALQYSASTRAMLTETSAESAGGLTHLLTNSTFIDWSVAITASTKYLPGTFRVVFYFTDDTSNENTPMVGQWMQLMPEGTNKAWKAHRAEQKVKRLSSLEPIKNGTVTLTASLLDQVAAGQLASLDADVVVPFLKEHLAWRVIGEDSLPIEGEDLDAFVIDVISTKVRIPDDPSEMLEYDDEVTSHPEATEGSRGLLPTRRSYCRWALCGSS